MEKKLIISFEEYLDTVEKLSIEINKKYEPTVLVGIMRGAAPIIDILSRIFKLPTAYVVIQSYSGTGVENHQGELIFSRDISSIANEKEYSYTQIISAFKYFFKALILVLLFTISFTIGFLLLFVPGIIVALMFSQIFYIIADDPETGVIEAFKKSASLMKNNKLQLFGLGMRYFGLFILGVFTLGIWWLWLIPQAYVSFAIFYKELQS